MGLRSASLSESLLEASGQRLKLAAALVLFVGGIGIAWIAWIYLHPHNLALSIVVGCSLAVTVVGVTIALGFVRCSTCGLRWVPWSMRTQPHSKWLEWLLTFEQCPRCGTTSEGSRMASKEVS